MAQWCYSVIVYTREREIGSIAYSRVTIMGCWAILCCNEEYAYNSVLHCAVCCGGSCATAQASHPCGKDGGRGQALPWSLHSRSLGAAAALNMSVFLLIGKTSALTMNLAGVVKDWLLIGLSVMLYKCAAHTLNPELAPPNPKHNTSPCCHVWGMGLWGSRKRPADAAALALAAGRRCLLST